MHGAHTDPSRMRDAFNQRLRFRRFLLAGAVSALYLIVLAVFHSQDKIDRTTLLLAAAIVASLIAVFFALFRLGLNLRFADPSLTALQVLAAVSTMLLVVYRAPETRLVFAAFFFVAMMFGMLRSTGTQLSVLAILSLVAYGLVALLRYADARDIETLRQDVLQLVVSAITIPCFVFIGMRVRRLQEADRRKDEFLATLAHELRNPLAPIRTGVEILRMTGTDSPPHVVPMMERQLTHMTRLLDDLLDLSRITRDKISLHVERIDLRQAVQVAVEACRPLIEQMGHELTLSVPSGPAFLHADPVRLAQILSNLLNNAARYTPRGGRIVLKAEHRGSEVELTVGDSGIGIPREKLASIFEMFAQIEDPVLPGHGGGLGIGLSVVKRLVTLHGGTIEARSGGPGRGSEFRVTLPTQLPLAESGSQTVRAEATRRTMKILVVDDNRDAATSLSTLLGLMGHDVRIAHDGESALEIADRFRPQLVLLDLGMPGVDGYEACRRIRKRGWGEAVTLIAVTGWGQDDDRRKSTAAGFDGHFVKPLSPETLEQLLGQAGMPV